jgi:hypothetical protein
MRSYFVIPTGAAFFAAERRAQRAAILSARWERSSSCQSRLKSLHFGLSDSIRAIFVSRRHDLICFSRAIAFADVGVLLEVD